MRFQGSQNLSSDTVMSRSSVWSIKEFFTTINSIDLKQLHCLSQLVYKLKALTKDLNHAHLNATIPKSKQDERPSKQRVFSERCARAVYRDSVCQDGACLVVLGVSAFRAGRRSKP